MHTYHAGASGNRVRNISEVVRTEEGMEGIEKEGGRANSGRDESANSCVEVRRRWEADANGNTGRDVT